MSTKHLLPCRCGKKIEVDVRQAGQTITCQCGAMVDVPTMRQVRQLERAATTGGKTAPRWSPLQGAVFAAGVLIAVISLSVLVVLFVRRIGIDTGKPEVDLKVHADWIHSQDVDTLWEEWMSDLAVQPLRRMDPEYLVNRRRVARLDFYMLIAAGTAVFGTVVTAAAFLIAPGHKRRSMKKPPAT